MSVNVVLRLQFYAATALILLLALCKLLCSSSLGALWVLSVVAGMTHTNK